MKASATSSSTRKCYPIFGIQNAIIRDAAHGLIVAAVLAGVFGFSGRFYDDEVTHIIFYVWLFIGTLPFSFGIIGLFLPNDTLNLANTIVNYFHPKENEIYK